MESIMASVIVKVGDSLHKYSAADGESASPLVTIGRAFSNDVILTDPYIGPSQLEIHNTDNSEYDWHVRITDSTNPVFRNNKIIDSAGFDISSGDEIAIGRTNITIFSGEHEVAETREFSFTNWLHNHKFKPLIASAMFLFLLGVTLLMGYLELSTELLWTDLSAIVIVVAVVAFLWASGWALVGHLFKGHHHFFSHLFFTSISFILFLITADMASYVDYIFNSKLAGEIIDWSIVILLSGVLFGFNLALVSFSPGAFRNGLIASICIWGVVLSLDYLYQENYSNQPEHSVTIKPSYIPTGSAVSIEVYIEGYDALFEELALSDDK